MALLDLATPFWPWTWPTAGTRPTEPPILSGAVSLLPLGVSREDECIDYDALAEQAREVRLRLIVAGPARTRALSISLDARWTPTRWGPC